MRFEKLGRAFTLLSIVLILGLGAINLITIGLYGRVNSAYLREQIDREQWEVANWALQVSLLFRLGEGFSPHVIEISALGWTGKPDEESPAALAIYRPDGTLYSHWLRTGPQGNTAATVESSRVSSLIPNNLIAAKDPCQESTVSALHVAAPQIRTQKVEQKRYSVLTLPIFFPADSGNECAGMGLVIFHVTNQESSWPLLASLLQILTVLTVAVGGLLILRFVLRPAANTATSASFDDGLFSPSEKKTAEFIVGSFQTLIDGLQVERAELSRLHDVAKARAAFIEQFNDMIVASITGGLIVVEQTGFVVVANGYARKLFQPELADQDNWRGSEMEKLMPLVGVNYQQFFACAPRLCEMISATLKGGGSVALEEFEARRHDHSTSWLAATVSPMDWRAGDNNVPGVLCLVTDFTEMAELRQRLRLQENLANLGEMAAGIAHEFKNSLATILGYGQLLQSISADETAQKSARALVDEVQHLSQVVTDFLNFARPQQVQRGQISLAELMADCCEAMADKAKMADVEITRVGEFPQITGDQTLLRRAFLNLLHNGIEAMNHETRRRAITIKSSIAKEENSVVLEFTDTGTGIAAADLQKIFIPFFTTKSRGFGIGLALVQKIILAHQGSVKAVSREGEGTTFYCTLPMSQER